MNKINYQLELDKITDKIVADRKLNPDMPKPTVLLHSCCGPCSSYVLSYLVKFFDITVLYYNPSIAPTEEYDHRKAVQLSLISQLNEKGYDIKFQDCDYNHDEFLKIAEGLESEREGGARCHKCYEQRIRAAADYAVKGGFDYFCTTLTVSPYKNAQVLNDIGARVSKECGIPYLFSDFKKKEGYKESIRLSKVYDLYRQDYCGCEFSFRQEIEH